MNSMSYGLPSGTSALVYRTKKWRISEGVPCDAFAFFMGVTLKSKLPDIADHLRSEVSRAVKEAAQAVADEAKARVPVDEGDLRDAIHIERREAGAYAVVAGNEDVYWGHYVEHGTQASEGRNFSTGPRPFLVPALELERTRIAERIERALEDADDG
jgi:HK97 gp10 family phage protein